MRLEDHLDAAYEHLEAASRSTRLGPSGSVGRYLMQRHIRIARRALRSVVTFLQMRASDPAGMDRPHGYK